MKIEISNGSDKEYRLLLSQIMAVYCSSDITIIGKIRLNSKNFGESLDNSDITIMDKMRLNSKNFGESLDNIDKILVETCERN